MLIKGTFAKTLFLVSKISEEHIQKAITIAQAKPFIEENKPGYRLLNRC